MRRPRLVASIVTVAIWLSWSSVRAVAVLSQVAEQVDPTAAAPPAPAQVISQQQRDLLRTAANKFQSAVLAIGCGTPDSTNAEPWRFATAFVISKKHRLLATAAHVADESVKQGYLAAGTGDGSIRLRVARAYYHPQLRRTLDKGVVTETMDVADGPIAQPTFDVAVLVLADALPAELSECVLAADAELHHLSRRPFGILGFPVADGNNWPSPALHVVPTLGTGKIERVVAYKPDPPEDRIEDSDSPEAERRWLRTPAILGPGGSGSPLFLENGHVVAVLFSAAREFRNGEYHAYEESLRIDAIREILSYHGLVDPFVDPLGRAPDKPLPEDDRRLARLRYAVALSTRANYERRRGNFAEAGTLVNKAIELVPDYAGAYLRRAENYLDYTRLQWSALTPESRHHYAVLARSDAERCDSRLVATMDSEGTILEIYARLYQCTAIPNTEILRGSMRALDRLLSEDSIHNFGGSAYRAKIFNARAHFHALASDFEHALSDYSQAIALATGEPRWLRDRARFWRQRNRPDLAAKDESDADKLARKGVDRDK